MIKYCEKCKERIDENYTGERFKRYCSLITYEKGKEIESKHWHLYCFTEWFGEQSSKKAIEMFNKAMGDSYSQLMPKLKEMMI
jgi:hypothetical protein